MSLVPGSGHFFPPDEFVGYDDITNRDLVLLEPPNARHNNRVTEPSIFLLGVLK